MRLCNNNVQSAADTCHIARRILYGEVSRYNENVYDEIRFSYSSVNFRCLSKMERYVRLIAEINI